MVPEEAIAAGLDHVLKIVGQLPSGEHADTVRRSLAELVDATARGVGVEEATGQLVHSLHQLDESHVGGLRREFQRQAPAIGRVLETLQEDLLPALRRAGFHV